jgi:apolipoprotein N-acyltransferase
MLLASASVAALWVAQDGLRTALLDWPWLKLGYTQLDSPIGGFASVGGEPLVTFVCVFVAALLANMLRWLRSTTKTSHQIWLAGLAVGTLFVSGGLLKQVDWTSSKGTAMTVNLLQANIPIDQKWDARYRDTLMEYYANLAERLPVLYEDSSNLVVTIMPETALPVPLHTISQDYWRHLASNDQTALLSGITEVQEGQGNNAQVSNAAVFRCDGVNTVYRKRTLVPFGERLPFAAVFGGMYEAIGLNAANYHAGDTVPALSCDGVSLAVAVCFEIMFDQTDWIRDFDVLININEEGWYFETLAPIQRLFYARMRAMEMARPVVSMSNNGPSVVIDYRGRITDLTEVNQAVVHTTSIELRSGFTPYHQYGNLLVWGIVSLILLLTVLAKITARR